MDIQKLIARVKQLLLSPKEAWPVLAAEPATIKGLYLDHVLVLAALPAIFAFIKGSLIGYGAFGFSMRIGIGAGLSQLVLGYALWIAVVYLMGLLIDALAPSFGGEKNPVQAFKTGAYAYTAFWIAGIGVVLPGLGMLVVLAGAVYSIYLLYLGLPSTMKCPPEKAGGYTATLAIIGFVLGLVLATVVGMMSGAAMMANGGIGAVTGKVGDSQVTVDPDSAMGKLAEMGAKMEAASKKVEAAKQSGDKQAEAQAAGQMVGALLGGGDQVEALAPAVLKPFLPESLGGLKRTHVSVEKNGMMGIQVATGQAEYRDDSGEHSLSLEITDTGGAKGTLAFASWAVTEQESETDTGYEKSYKEGGRMVHEEWDSNSKHGEFGLVLGERFAVKLQGEGFDMKQLKGFVGSLNLSGLEALKDQGVKKG